MNGNSNISKGLSAHAAGRHTAPRWRMVFIALMLALILGSVGQTAPAQAAPASELVNFTMTVVNPKTTLKCGETVTYLVKVELKQADVNQPTPFPGPSRSPKGLPVLVTKVEAYSTVVSVGDFVDAKKGIALTKKTTVVFQDDLATLGTKFKFKAEKVGKTILWFQGLVGEEYVEAKVNVKVIPCQVKVKTLIKSSDEIWNLTGISDEAVMKPDENGNYTGSSTVSWVYAYVGSPCVMSASATDMQIDLTGKLDDDGGQFVATETFHPVTVSMTITCPYAGTIITNGESSSGNMPPLTFSVASSGGTSTQALGNASATIFVIPEEDKAVAFIPGNPEARVGPPSPRWATLWDDFSSLFGVLLALR